MSIARAGMVLFGLAALTVGAAYITDIYATGQPTLVSPLLLATFGLGGVALLFLGLIEARGRAQVLDRQAIELKSLNARLAASLAEVSAANERFLESEVRYRSLVDSQGDPIFRRTPDSRLTFANDAFFKLFGINPQTALGRPFAPELHPHSRAPYFGSFAGLETGKMHARYDQYVRTAYGWRWIAWEDYAIRDGKGRLVEVQSVGRDITERKAMEEALTEARDKAEAASRAKSGFLATMSHEIRTPMNGVLGMARLLAESRLTSEQRTYINTIQQSGETLLALIEDILDFSKIESGALTLAEDEMEPRVLVEGVIELLGPRAHAKGIELVNVVAPDTPAVVLADAIRLRQIVINLVGNAVKFTEKGGVRVDVWTSQSRDRRFLRVEVRDTGVGVPAEKREEIFNEFVQADSTHARRFGGTGLGLAICRRLVAAMGGEIGLDPAPGGGSLFWFTLPVLVIKEAEASQPLSGRRIALTTKNAVLRDALSEQIRAGGGEVVAPNYKGILERDIDTVLVDAGTLDTSELPSWSDPNVRSILLVTPAARAFLSGLSESGFSAYLVKPVRQASLEDRILSKDRTDMAEDEGEGSGKRISAARPLKILLAEDNAVNAFVTREMLTRRGHEVHEVTSGEAAIVAMDEERFDLLLTDIHMPGLDGIEAARRIRVNELKKARTRTPIVALTADVLDTGKQACQDVGMNGFLTKPIDPAELDAMFAKLFPDSAKSAAA